MKFTQEMHYLLDHFQFLQLLVEFLPNKTENLNSWRGNVLSQKGGKSEQWARVTK